MSELWTSSQAEAYYCCVAWDLFELDEIDGGHAYQWSCRYVEEWIKRF